MLAEDGCAPETIIDHVREHYRVALWCPRCLHVERLDLARLVEQGCGGQTLEALAAALRCTSCRSRAQLARRSRLTEPDAERARATACRLP